MERIEKEFSDLKEKFFSDQIESLSFERDRIRDGKHERYIEKAKELEEKKNEKLWAAQQWREYQLQNINQVFESEKRQAEDDFKGERSQLKERMVVAIEDKVKKLEEEKVTLNLTDGSDTRIMTRTLRRRGKDTASTLGSTFSSSSSQTTKKRSNPPSINYLLVLKESEILDDLAAIQKRGIHAV